MSDKKKGLLGVLLLFCVFILVAGIIYVVSSLPVTAYELSQVVPVKPAVTADELQDANGKFVLQDYPDVDLNDYIVLGDYRNMTITDIPVHEVTDEEVMASVTDYIQYWGRYQEITEGTVETGDAITISYTGYLDDVVMDDYVSEENKIRLGSSDQPAGFVNALHGAKIGEDLSFDVTMPDDWTDEATKGKQMHFHAHIYNKLVVPELTEDTVEFISDGEYKTVDEFLAYIRSSLESYYRSVNLADISDEVITELDRICQYKTPDHKLLTWSVSIFLKYYQSYADYYGKTVEEIIASLGLSTDMDEFMKTVNDAALAELPFQVTLTAIAKDAGITVDAEADADLINERIQYLIQSAGYKDEADVRENYRESNLIHDVLNQKTLDWLCEIVTRVPAEPESNEGVDTVSSEDGDTEQTNSADNNQLINESDSQNVITLSESEEK